MSTTSTQSHAWSSKVKGQKSPKEALQARIYQAQDDILDQKNLFRCSEVGLQNE